MRAHRYNYFTYYNIAAHVSFESRAVPLAFVYITLVSRCVSYIAQSFPIEYNNDESEAHRLPRRAFPSSRVLQQHRDCREASALLPRLPINKILCQGKLYIATDRRTGKCLRVCVFSKTARQLCLLSCLRIYILIKYDVSALDCARVGLYLWEKRNSIPLI